MRIFITGVAGFLGSHIADKLIAEGHEVAGCDNLICGSYENFKKYADVDCCDTNAMKFLLDKFKPDVVVHCAATAHEGFSLYSPSFITRNIYEASVSVFSAAIASGVKRIVYMSSMARYGNQEPPFTEDMQPKPIDPYGIAKVAAEDTLKVLCRLHDVKWSILVPHNLIGVRQKYDDPYRNVASIMMNRLLQNKPPIIYGDGEQTRCFSPVADVLPSIINAVAGWADSEVVNIGPDDSNNTLTIKALAEKLSNFTGYNGEAEYHPARGCDAKDAYCSSDKSRKLLYYTQMQSVDNCLKEMIEDIKLKGTKDFNYFMPIEIPSDKCPRTWKERLL